MRTKCASLLVCLALGCAGNGGKASPDGATPVSDGGSDTTTVACTTDPSLATASAEALFGAATIPAFDLTLPAESWQWLKDHARDEQYVQATACYEGRAIGTVGMRFKGSYGSLYNCFDASGKNICRKLGIKLKFDEYVDQQRFFGLKRLNFQGYRWDDSYLKERLSYDLYRAMGIVAPRAAWAQIRVNGEPQGLFGMVESIDGTFVKDRFPGNGENNLYKEAWPGQTDDAWLVAHLETNEAAADVTAFKAFSAALDAAPATAVRPTLAQYMDLEYFARYMAVDDAVANFDGVITYYTSGAPDEAGNHNFFFYEESPQRFTIIPWDLEATMSMASNYGYVPPWQTVPADCTQIYPVWGGQNQVIAPGCDRVFHGLAEDLTQYRTAARTLLDTHFTVERMRANIDGLAAFIRPAATLDPHGPGAAAFESAVGFLKSDLPRLRARLEHLVSGAPTVPLAITPVGLNDFEGLDDYGLVAGGMLMCNGNTTIAVAIDATTPLAGAKTCRVSFNFGNESKSWQQWAWYKMPFVAQPTNLNQYTGVRFKVRSNVARTLRFDIDSPNYKAASQGIQLGWDVPVDTVGKTVEVRFAEAKIPGWAADAGDNLTTIMQTASALVFQPICVGRDGSGQLPAGVSDNGFLDLDDIEIF